MPIVISIKSEDDIPSLNKKDVVARFTRDGCTHCESSQDAWDKVCKILEHEYEDKEKAAVMEVESRLENALGFQFPDGSPYVVRGYPTVANFKQGIFSGEHDGGRTAKELIVHIHDVLKLKKKPKRKTRRSKHKRRSRAHKSHKRRATHTHSGRHNRSPHRHRSPRRHRDTPRRRDKYRRRTRREPMEVIDLSELLSGGGKGTKTKDKKVSKSSLGKTFKQKRPTPRQQQEEQQQEEQEEQQQEEQQEFYEKFMSHIDNAKARREGPLRFGPGPLRALTRDIRRQRAYGEKLKKEGMTDKTEEEVLAACTAKQAQYQRNIGSQLGFPPGAVRKAVTGSCAVS